MEQRKYYYLRNDNIFISSNIAPNKSDYHEPYIKYNEDYNYWYALLKPCKINLIDLKRIKKYINYDGNFKPVDITNIVNAEYDGHYENIIITFRHPEEIKTPEAPFSLKESFKSEFDIVEKFNQLKNSNISSPIPIPNIPKNTNGSIVYVDSIDGFFIEFSGNDLKIVLRKDGIDYKQSFEEFISNSKKPNNHV
jgi:hypothetical protein